MGALAWLERCERPNCWIALSALHGSSSVMWMRRRWLRHFLSACTPSPRHQTQAPRGVTPRQIKIAAQQEPRLQRDARARGVADDSDELAAVHEGLFLVHVELHLPHARLGALDRLERAVRLHLHHVRASRELRHHAAAAAAVHKVVEGVGGELQQLDDERDDALEHHDHRVWRAHLARVRGVPDTRVEVVLPRRELHLLPAPDREPAHARATP